jgi:P-type Cu2+ transporter
MTCCAGSLPASLAAEKASQSNLQHLEEVTRSALQLPDGSYMLRLSVPEMHCAACMSTIERNLASVAGVVTARVNLTLRQLTVTFSDLASVTGVVSALDSLGYRHHVTTTVGEPEPELKRLVRALAVAGFAAANVMLLSVSIWNGAEPATRDLFHFISAVIALPAIAYSGQPFFRSAIAALRHRRMNMDVPISLGVLLATGMSIYESAGGGGHAYFDAAISLLFFLLIGRTLDVVMRGRARQLVSRMAQLASRGGMRILPDGNLNYVPLDGIVPGMLLRVAAGDRLPVDGRIVRGSSIVDRSLVTGESEAVPVVAGQQLEAGVLNLSGALDIHVLHTAEKSFLGEVVQMLAAAEQGRGRYVRIADRMARIYSPAVHVLALATFVYWIIASTGNWHQSLTTAVAVLIITCPCALGLAVPVAHVVAASRLFRHGILVKDGGGLERLADVDHAAFDKTGTLTSSNLEVSEIAHLPGEDADIVKSLALSSSHPAARAVSRHLQMAATVLLKNVIETPGFGVEATFKGKTCRLGRGDWVSEITQARSAGSGLSFGMQDGRHVPISLTETLRPGASALIQSLARRGIASEIISGDREEAVLHVARQLGMSAYSAAMKPASKLERLHALALKGRKVLMVGDGLNDAPALAAAHVSMAPASASDIGRTAADFVFMGDSLDAISIAHQTAVRTKRIVQQNFALAAIYNALAVPLAMAGYLNPLIAAIAMSTSSLLVVGNSLRLGEMKWVLPRDKHHVAPRPSEVAA